jgi:hypothetical protein
LDARRCAGPLLVCLRLLETPSRLADGPNSGEIGPRAAARR